MLKDYAALIGPVLAFLGALCGSILSARIERKRMNFQYGGKEKAREALEDMLNHKKHVDRSFDALSARVPTYSRKEVGDMLHHAIGAVPFKRGDEEWWYLQERVEEHVANRR